MAGLKFARWFFRIIRQWTCSARPCAGRLSNGFEGSCTINKEVEPAYPIPLPAGAELRLMFPNVVNLPRH